MSEIKQNTLLEDALKELAELQQENVQLKQDLVDARDRLAHVEPIFHMAKEMYRIPNPYSQGQKQAEICAYFRAHKYADWYEENGL